MMDGLQLMFKLGFNNVAQDIYTQMRNEENIGLKKEARVRLKGMKLILERIKNLIKKAPASKYEGWPKLKKTILKSPEAIG